MTIPKISVLCILCLLTLATASNRGQEKGYVVLEYHPERETGTPCKDVKLKSLETGDPTHYYQCFLQEADWCGLKTSTKSFVRNTQLNNRFVARCGNDVLTGGGGDDGNRQLARDPTEETLEEALSQAQNACCTGRDEDLLSFDYSAPLCNGCGYGLIVVLLENEAIDTIPPSPEDLQSFVAKHVANDGGGKIQELSIHTSCSDRRLGEAHGKSSKFCVSNLVNLVLPPLFESSFKGCPADS